jgi:hypothetical protein
VRALRNIHTAVRPGGVLIDLQPARRSRLELARGGQTLVVGVIDESPGYAALQVGLDALRDVTSAGLFAPESETSFPILYHCGSVDEWIEEMAGHWHRARVAPELIARARSLAADAPDGVLRVSRMLRAARFRRLDQS